MVSFRESNHFQPDPVIILLASLFCQKRHSTYLATVIRIKNDDSKHNEQRRYFISCSLVWLLVSRNSDQARNSLSRCVLFLSAVFFGVFCCIIIINKLVCTHVCVTMFLPRSPINVRECLRRGLQWIRDEDD